MRTSGVLMPVSSLPSRYGIGCFSKEAYEFVDFLKESGQSRWQILPLGPTGYGDSPYQSFSTFAGNPYFIDLEQLIQEGLLDRKDCQEHDWGTQEEQIDYEKIYQGRFPLLKKAHAAWRQNKPREWAAFLETEGYWVKDYALYMAVKEAFAGKSWSEWEEGIRVRRPEAVKAYEEKLADQVEFWGFTQFYFQKQWKKLKAYANQNGVSVIGDIPIYVALDSADTWANPKLFQLDEKNIPVKVAGCPPDGFSATGQLWGNPLYTWEYHKKTGYAWWLQRVRHCFQLYDIMRIDHFRGFDEYYAIPYGEKTAENGAWEAGPGMELFAAIRERLGELPIIAEDLGFLTDSVRKLLADSGYPGMKVLQFAFDSREESDYLPHNYERNAVVYTGTHDNDTLQGWYRALEKEDKEMALSYLNNQATADEEIHWDYICLAMRSVADTCIIPMQDYLGLGGSARINTPSTLGGNWCWRMKQGALSGQLAKRIGRITSVCGRV
ncbi:4-alpha-glucanotransferase [Suipraeoptans intestinalis]|uniref:4-alpha-glucanotransferase n=1 Tax=Suipraeoptans intestinalis TaxID=2606628 RepID=UPI002A762DC5|nr:4-alpha-glucanotransferase [Suipraeoptans intestinalis]MDY3121065.1 4-alpha-glucanotransferase [Suipraeoptans intestinalis]